MKPGTLPFAASKTTTTLSNHRRQTTPGQGLSIIARRKQPEYVHAFMSALLEVMHGATQEAAAVDEWSCGHADRIRALVAEVEAQEEREPLSQRATAATAATTTAPSEPHDGASSSAARDFFLKHLADKKGKQPELSGVKFDKDEGSAVAASTAANGTAAFEPAEPKVQLSGLDIQELDDRFRRCHSAAVLAGAAADSAAALVLSSSMRASLAALNVVEAAVAALRRTTAALERDEAIREECGAKEAERLKPPRPASPKMLPTVASTWPLLIAALRDARAPVVERACAVVAAVTVCAGGQFLARRFHTEAWPLLSKLLASGTAALPSPTAAAGGGSGSSPSRPRSAALLLTLSMAAMENEQLAPAAVQRVQLAAVHCLQRVAADAEAAKALRGIAWDVGAAVLPLLGSAHSAAMHEAVVSLLLAVAQVDSDAVWLLLHDVVQAADGKGAAAAAVAGAAQRKLPPSLPPASRLLPPLQASNAASKSASQLGGQRGAWPVTPTLAADCAVRAQALLARVSKLPAAWHRVKVPDMADDGDGVRESLAGLMAQTVASA